jgi:hypothetical protein
MNFANYTDFRTTVLKMTDGDDANSTALSQPTLDLLIALGEQAVWYGMTGPQGEEIPGLRCADMEADLSLTVASNLAPLPADCIEVIRVQQTGEYPMSYVAEEEVLRQIKTAGTAGEARQYSQQGRNLIFWPTLADNAAVGGRYYKKFADISGGILHDAFNRYPDLWLYAALAESSPFLGEDARIALWKAQYKGRLLAANRAEQMRAPSGSRLTMRTR